MRKFVSKLRSRAGESFAEVLVALLIVALAALLMASMVVASGGIDAETRQEDSEFYAAITAVETGAGESKTGTVTVEQTDGSFSKTIDVKVHEKDGLTAYEVTP